MANVRKKKLASVPQCGAARGTASGPPGPRDPAPARFTASWPARARRVATYEWAQDADVDVSVGLVAVGD